MTQQERFDELASKLDGVEEGKKPFLLSLLQSFVKWESIEQELIQTKLFEKNKFRGQEVVKELPTFKMLNTATARKEDAIKAIVKLLDGEVEEESPLVKALNKFNNKDKVEIR